jgi:hypothetical protein
MAYQTSKSDLSLASSVTKFVAMICMSLNPPKAEQPMTVSDSSMAYQASKSDLSCTSSVTKLTAMICMSLNTPKEIAHTCVDLRMIY